MRDKDSLILEDLYNKKVKDYVEEKNPKKFLHSVEIINNQEIWYDIDGNELASKELTSDQSFYDNKSYVADLKEILKVKSDIFESGWGNRWVNKNGETVFKREVNLNLDTETIYDERGRIVVYRNNGSSSNTTKQRFYYPDGSMIEESYANYPKHFHVKREIIKTQYFDVESKYQSLKYRSEYENDNILIRLKNITLYLHEEYNDGKTRTKEYNERGLQTYIKDPQDNHYFFEYHPTDKVKTKITKNREGRIINREDYNKEGELLKQYIAFDKNEKELVKYAKTESGFYLKTFEKKIRLDKEGNKHLVYLKKYDSRGKILYGEDERGLFTLNKYDDKGNIVYSKHRVSDSNDKKNLYKEEKAYRDKNGILTVKGKQEAPDKYGHYPRPYRFVNKYTRSRMILSYKKYDDGKTEIEKRDPYGGHILYEKDINGKEGFYTWGHCGLLEYKASTGEKEIYKYSPKCNPIYEKINDGPEEIWEYLETKDGEVLKYHKDKEGREEILDYITDNNKNVYLTRHKKLDGTEEIIRYDTDFKKIYHKHPDGREEGWDEHGNKTDFIATKKAEKYNKLYHGIFIHSLPTSRLGKLLEIKKSGDYAELCVSTVRSNTVFRSEETNIVLVGFGQIRELYDFDAYSEIGYGGKRYSTKTIKQSEELHDINKVDNVNGYDEDLHYDEGFMNFEDAEVIFASVPRHKRTKRSSAKGDPYGSTASESRIYFETIRALEKLNPYIKIISPETFGKIKNSEELLRLTYKLKEQQDDERLLRDPKFRFEEKKMFTFKKYMMLKESLVQIPLDNAYEIFRNEYEKATGKSWDKNKFISRAANWEFYGDENGYVAIRRQRSGFVKLVGMAGNNKSKLKGMQDLISMNVPLWGMVSKEIKDIAIRKGMRMPNFLERQVLKRNISPQVFGDAKILDYMKDGGVKIQYPDVGVVVKYLVGTPSYYSELKKRFGDKIKNYFHERQ